MKSTHLKRVIALSMALTVAAGVSFGSMVTVNAATPSAASYEQTLTNKSYLSSATVRLGETVTVNARASGGVGDYKYSVIYKKKTSSSWNVVQNYSTNSVITIKPASAAEYQVCVKVKDNSGNIAKKYFTITAEKPLKNTSSISSGLILKGDKVTVNAGAYGGQGGYKYSVLYKKNTSKSWNVLQDYKDNSTVTITPASAADYEVCVKVKDKGGNVTKRYLSFSVTTDVTLVYAKEVIRLTNSEREKAGLPPLTEYSLLSEAAAKRAQELAELFSHRRPDGSLCFSLLNDYGIDNWGAAENIAQYYPTPEAAVEAWMNSDGHRDNILTTDMSEIGVGVYKTDGKIFWVQLFINPPVYLR